MKSFFPMQRGEGAVLVFLIAFAAFSFIPAWRTIEVGGMAVFGWLIATLMVTSPALALFMFWRMGRGRASRETAPRDRAGGEGGPAALGDGGLAALDDGGPAALDDGEAD